MDSDANIDRRMLRAALQQNFYTAHEFEAFCLDFFPEVARRFSSGMDRVAMENLLIELVTPSELVNALAQGIPGFNARRLQALPSGLEIARSLDDDQSMQPELVDGSGRKFRAAGPPIVCCSCHGSDAAMVSELALHLSLLERQDMLQFIRLPLQQVEFPAQTRVLLLLLSPQYLSHPNGLAFIERAVNWHERTDGGMLFAMLRRSLWDSTPLSRLKPLLDAKAVVNWPNRDDAWIQIASAVRAAIQFPPSSLRTLAAGAGGVAAGLARGLLGIEQEREPPARPKPDKPAKVKKPPAKRRPKAGLHIVQKAPADPLPDKAAPEEMTKPAQFLTLAEIFPYSGQPSVNYVATEQTKKIRSKLTLPAEPECLVVEGPSGIGKTTQVRHVLSQLEATERTIFVLATDNEDLLKLDRVLGQSLAGGGYLVIDDFHLLPFERQVQVARLVKRLCDRSRRDAKVVIVGINPLGASLTDALDDLEGRHEIVAMQGKQPLEKIDELIHLGEQAANIEFVERAGFVQAACGSFALAQKLCYEAAAQAGIIGTIAVPTKIKTSPQVISEQLRKSAASYFRPHLLTFATFDETDRPRGAGLYALWELSRSTSWSINLHELRLRAKPNAGLHAAYDWLLSGNLARLFQEHKRLGKLLYYNPATQTLSAENLRLWFYLSQGFDWMSFALDSNHSAIALDAEERPVLADEESVPKAGRPEIQSNPADAQPVTVPLFRVLHVSDLHFSGDRAQAQRWYGQLAEDLTQNLKLSTLDAVVVSGDIANRGTEPEYQAAQQFFLKLNQEFQILPHQIILVPGNHDLSWDLAREAYTAMRRESYKGTLRSDADYQETPTNPYIEIRKDRDYPQRFQPFDAFYQQMCGESYPLAAGEQALLRCFESAGILFLGLNSAWQIDHLFRDRSSINADAVSRALDEIRLTDSYKKCWLKIAVFHHPVGGADGARLHRDAESLGFLQRLANAGFQVAMHGHIHEADAATFPYYKERNFHILGAGTLGAAVEHRPPSVPLHYQLLEITSGQIRVWSRRRAKESGAWEPDARYRQNRGKVNLDYDDIKL